MGAIGGLLSVALLLLGNYQSTIAQPSLYEVANKTSKSWTNRIHTARTHLYSNLGMRYILKKDTSGPVSAHFGCGFFWYLDRIPQQSYLTYQFGIILAVEEDARVVWSANQSRGAQYNATLHLTSDKGLTLLDVDGTPVWSTETKGKFVAGLNLTETGNLVLFDSNGGNVWQSFDHPTDTLLLGQKLVPGQKLTSTTTSSANDSQGGSYSLLLTNSGIVALLEINPPQIYFQATLSTDEPAFFMLLNGSWAAYSFSSDSLSNELTPLWIPRWDAYGFSSYRLSNESTPLGSPMQHVRLDSNGHFRFYDWVGSQWKTFSDVLAPRSVDDCNYPLVCGQYSMCSQVSVNNVGCSCPTNFKPINNINPYLGCSPVTPFSCEMSQYHKLVKLENVTHLPIPTPYTTNTTEECVQACLKNCSCKAAMFKYLECHLLPYVVSLVNKPVEGVHFFVKVQAETGPPPSPPVYPTNQRKRVALIIGSSIGAFLGLVIFATICVLLSRKKTEAFDFKDDYLSHVPGMPRRYSYEDLMAVTGNFETRLGQGGFGSVFKGILEDGTHIAVKLLDGLGQIKQSFLVEIKAIGNVHHLNLVRLLGFCAQKSHRLLVYEFMYNGSLDKWIFHGNPELALDWQTRRKIIVDIAKGLSYLHEECTQKILHLDIKPQNILLDENFNAKISDFGLSRLTDRDQSQVVTIMRGTPGYMAPEWLSSAITEKVDVYSFGVVVLEILCGRRNVDRSHPAEELHLLSLFKKKAEEGQLSDLVDKCCPDMQKNLAEVLEMMKVAAWCLQGDFARRPSMSLVVKVLEGSAAAEDDLDYDFRNPTSRARPTAEQGHGESTADLVATPLLPSELSAPR